MHKLRSFSAILTAFAVAVSVSVLAVGPSAAVPNVAAEAVPTLAADAVPTLAAGAVPTLAATPAPFASAAISTSTQQAIDAGAAAAAGHGVTTYAAVLDRGTGQLLGRTANAGTQVASESLVKMILAAYYLVQSNGKLSPSVSADLRRMIMVSDDALASRYWTANALPTISARYGLVGLAAARPYAGYWGATRVTADALAKFLYRAGKDPAVGPWLFDAMVATSDFGSDGYNQNIGFNTIAGAGSKQGWGNDNWVNGVNAVHSAGFTSRYVAVVLQSGGSGTYSLMRDTATVTATKINAAVLHSTVTRIAATTTSALADREMTISGAVVTGGGSAISGVKMRLYAKTQRGPWRYQGVALTNAAGKASFTINTGLEGQMWKVEVPAQAGYSGSEAQVLVYVRRAITGVERLPDAATRNQVLVASGTTGTGYRGQTLRIQHITQAGWVNDGATVVQPDGTWKVYFRAAPGADTRYYRAYIDFSPGSYQSLTWSLVKLVVVK